MADKKACLISIVGTGRVAWNLGRALTAKGYAIQEVSGRNSENIRLLAAKLNARAVDKPSKLNPLCDLFILAVNDDAIEDVSAKLPENKGVVVHTSGMKPLSCLKGKFAHAGVFYPLQTFSFDRQADFENIPILLQAGNRDNLLFLENIAGSLSRNLVHTNDTQRQSIHLAAVFVNNFTNALYGIADDILKDKELSIKILYPLILETANKILDHSPLEAQTGPARRKDIGTIETHLKLLAGSEEKSNIYKLFTDYILNKYHPENNG